MLDPRLVVIGALRPSVQLRLLKSAGKLPRLTSYAIQSMVLGYLAEPFYWLQRLLYRSEKDMPPPTFVIGCWRSGTTYLHTELVKAAQASATRNTFTCCPQAALLGAGILKRVLPSFGHRFFDWVPLPKDGPQEVEIGLLKWTSEIPTTVVGLGKALAQACHQFAAWTPTASYKRKFRRMMRWAWLQDRKSGKPFITKAPAHTLQIPLLLELYPDAKFVYIERESVGSLKSIEKAIRSFNATFGLYPYEHDAKADALATREVVLRRYEETKHLIPKGNLVEVTYDDLVSRPKATVDRVVSALTQEPVALASLSSAS